MAAAQCLQQLMLAEQRGTPHTMANSAVLLTVVVTWSTWHELMCSTEPHHRASVLLPVHILPDTMTAYTKDTDGGKD